MTLIALAGNAGVGKDTVGDLLVKHRGFKKLSLAAPLKYLAETLFKLPHAALWGPSAERNKVLTPPQSFVWWQEAYARLQSDRALALRVMELFPNRHAQAMDRLRGEFMDDMFQHAQCLTARYVLQRLGTEWGRSIDAQVWLHAVKAIVDREPTIHWVITDTRFANEAQYLRDALDAKVVWIDASERVPTNPTFAHASEPTQAELAPWTHQVLDNNGPLDALPALITFL